jgi:hypothetical protein
MLTLQYMLRLLIKKLFCQYICKYLFHQSNNLFYFTFRCDFSNAEIDLFLGVSTTESGTIDQNVSSLQCLGTGNFLYIALQVTRGKDTAVER